MQGPSHLIISWFAAEAAGLDSPRERRIVALSGFAPDVDVLAYLGGIIYFGLDKELAFEHVWQVVHHRYTHGLGFVLLTGIVAFLMVAREKSASRRAGRVAVFSMAASVIHVFCDMVGGGPTWPVYPLWPISDFGWTVSWSWPLSDWPNTLILLSCLAGMMVYAKFSGYSPLESINYRLDQWFVRIIRHGSSEPRGEQEAGDGIFAAGRKALRVRVFIYTLLALLIIMVLAPLGFQTDQLNLSLF